MGGDNAGSEEHAGKTGVVVAAPQTGRGMEDRWGLAISGVPGLVLWARAGLRRVLNPRSDPPHRFDLVPPTMAQLRQQVHRAQSSQTSPLRERRGLHFADADPATFNGRAVESSQRLPTLAPVPSRKPRQPPSAQPPPMGKPPVFMLVGATGARAGPGGAGVGASKHVGKLATFYKLGESSWCALPSHSSRGPIAQKSKSRRTFPCFSHFRETCHLFPVGLRPIHFPPLHFR